MKKKRPRRTPAEPPGTRRTRAPAPALRSPGPLHYKVVELSTVEEGTLERTLNEWVGRGWNLDGVQFAMRESSKRPAMAFVFFTREGEAAPADTGAARERLRRLSEAGSPSAALLRPAGRGEEARPAHLRALEARERLAQLAGAEPARPARLGSTLREPEE
jgi:hypothetical protein